MSNSSPMPVPTAVMIAWISVFESTLLMRFFSLLMILPAQRQDRLEAAVAALLRGAAGRVALDDEELGLLRVGELAVGELARQAAARERALALDVARLARRLARPRGVDRLAHDAPALGRVLLEPLGELLVDGPLHEPGHPRVAELRLRLALELRVADLHRDDRGEPLARVLALEPRVLLLEQPVVEGDLVHASS